MILTTEHSNIRVLFADQWDGTADENRIMRKLSGSSNLLSAMSAASDMVGFSRQALLRSALRC